MGDEVKRLVTALRFCADHLYSCEGCPNEHSSCMGWSIMQKAADAIEHLAAELEEAKRKSGEKK